MAFGQSRGDGRNHLVILGDEAYSYETCIRARRADGIYVLNITKYSTTTSKHQSIVRSQTPSTGTVEVDNVPVGTSAFKLTQLGWSWPASFEIDVTNAK